MNGKQLKRGMEAMHDVISETFDHLASKFEGKADKLGEEFAHLVDFSTSWGKMSKRHRKVFVEELLKAAGIITVTALATKVGIDIAGKKQKHLRKAVIGAAGLITPMMDLVGKSKSKKAKKALKKLRG
jgi:polyhydroxyalkanoate synthesis regulator phasin